MKEDTDNSAQTLNPGQILKSAREKLSLSREEIAKKLNLQTTVIVALEEWDINTLPASTYVRGYLRSYARVVNLDADHLIDIYDQESSKTPVILPDVKRTQVSSSDKPVKIMTYLISFILVLLLLAWWQSHFIVEPETIPEEPEEVNVYTEYGGALNYDYEIVIHPDTPFLERKDSPVADTNENTVLDTYEEDVVENEISTSLGRIVIESEKDCWVDIRDAEKNKVYLGIVKAGSIVEIEGKAPFSVQLGYAPGVKVIFNGELFDTRPYEDAGVANFTLNN